MSKQCTEQLRRLVATGLPLIEAAAFLFVEQAERRILRLESEIASAVEELRAEEPRAVYKNPLREELTRRGQELGQWFK